MAIVINNFDENVEDGDAFTADVTGDDNLLIYGGCGLDTGTIATMGTSDHGGTSFVTHAIHDVETVLGTQTWVDASGHILDANIPTGSQTFNQNFTGTFPDTTFHLLTISGADQTTPYKEANIGTYNLVAPGSISFDVGSNGGLVVLQVTTNVNVPTTPSGWTVQGANKTVSTLSQYRIYTKLYTSASAGDSVTPVMDGDGTGRGFSRLVVYNAAAAAGGGLSIPVAMANYRRFR